MRYALESSIRLDFPQCLPHVLLATRTANFLECELPLMVRNRSVMERQGTGSLRDLMHTHPAMLVLREIHKREPALSEHLYDLDCNTRTWSA